ncbi:MAG: hypothetical protein NTW96_04705 [Planctomycetia bacterium]|nr:hypothetical protein [Planctomycetia bacterium]
MKEINPKAAFFIKLGSGGHWEQDCLQESQTIRLGFGDTDHAACLRHDWDKIRRDLLREGRTKGKATEIANEIRYFYESDENTLWVTFFGNRIWWAFADGKTTRLDDGSKIRAVAGQWHSTDIQGHPLTLDRISGRFQQVRRFQGTICSVDLEYAKNKINGRVSESVSQAQKALHSLEQRLVPLIQSLTWKDFELFVDLIFTNAGWQRISVLGKTQKTLDLDLKAPVTGERVMVQVKSTADRDEYERYYKEFKQSQDFGEVVGVVKTEKRSV